MALRTLSAIKALRYAVIDSIVAADVPGIGENVFEARKDDAWPEEGSFAVVYTDSFSFDDQRTSPKTYKCSGNVVVDIVCQEINETANDDLDDMSYAVVVALQPMMPKEGFFGGITKRFVLTSIENNLTSHGEMNRGCQRITFSTEFNVTITVGGPTDEFISANNEIAMGEGIGNKQTFTTRMRSDDG